MRERAGRECVTARVEQFIRPSSVLSYARYAKRECTNGSFVTFVIRARIRQKVRFVACCCASQYHAYAIGKRHRREFKRVQRVCTKKV